MGWVYLFTKQYEQALAEGKRALALDPNNADTHAVRADILSYMGRPKETIGFAQQAMRLNPRYPDWYPENLGVAYNLTGQYAEAIAAFKEALRLNPNLLSAYTYLAVAYVAQWGGQWSQGPQNLERALEAVQQVVALSDSTYWTHGILGFVYAWQKRYEEALAAFTQALSHKPPRFEELKAHLSLAASYQALGREEAAQAEAAAVLQINPHFSVNVWKQRVPYQDPAVIERIGAAPRKAGLK